MHLLLGTWRRYGQQILYRRFRRRWLVALVAVLAIAFPIESP